MSTQVNYQKLEQLVNDQPRVHDAAFYRNARPRTQKIYDQTIQMGKDILTDRNASQPSPQTMVDMVVQSINTAIKALKSNPMMESADRSTSPVQPQSSQASTQPSQPSSPAGAPHHAVPTEAPATDRTQSTAIPAATAPATDSAPAASPTAPQRLAIPSQPTTAEPTDPSQPTGERAGSERVQDTTVSAAPESAAAVKTDPAKSAAAKQETAAVHNLPMVVRQKADWHMLPQAIWRGLQWTLGSKKALG